MQFNQGPASKQELFALFKEFMKQYETYSGSKASEPRSKENDAEKIGSALSRSKNNSKNSSGLKKDRKFNRSNQRTFRLNDENQPPPRDK